METLILRFILSEKGKSVRKSETQSHRPKVNMTNYGGWVTRIHSVFMGGSNEKIRRNKAREAGRRMGRAHIVCAKRRNQPSGN